MSNPEYDAFGPWIYEINDEYPMPPLFSRHFKEDADHLMLIKIPRNIERRNARPGMDLYDYVIGMYTDHICILKRKDTSVEQTKIAYSDVQGIEDYRNLLKGDLTLFLRNEQITIPYNTVSEDKITRLIKIIRERYTEEAFELSFNAFDDSNLKLGDLFSNLLKKLHTSGEMPHIGAFQPAVLLAGVRGSALQRLKSLVRVLRLLESLHMANERELIIIGRGRVFNKWTERTYSYAVNYLPISKLKGVKLEDYKEYDGLKEIELILSRTSFKFYIEKGNGQSIDFYRRLRDI